HVRHLAADSEEQAALFLVIVPRILLAAVEIALVAAHGEPVFRRHGIRNDRAAIVDPAVALTADPVFELQFEITRPRTAIHDEGIALDDCGRCDFTDELAVLDAPVGWVPLPARQRFAVEDRGEAWLIARHRFGSIAF